VSAGIFVSIGVVLGGSNPPIGLRVPLLRPYRPSKIGVRPTPSDDGPFPSFPRPNAMLVTTRRVRIVPSVAKTHSPNRGGSSSRDSRRRVRPLLLLSPPPLSTAEDGRPRNPGAQEAGEHGPKRTPPTSGSPIIEKWVPPRGPFLPPLAPRKAGPPFHSPRGSSTRSEGLRKRAGIFRQQRR